MTKTKWLEVPAAENLHRLPEGELISIELQDKEICVGRYQAKLFACAGLCPHAGALLSKGYIDSRGNIVCPEHGYKFRMRDGFNCSGEGYKLRTYEMEVEEGQIRIGMGEAD